MKHFLLLIVLSLLPLAGCKRDSAPVSNLRTVAMAIGSKTYTLEITAKTLDRNKGLMYRDSMPDDYGMIFIFADEIGRSFWMRNTRIPLDILYLDSGGKVVSFHRMEAYVERGTKSKGPAKYAIELNTGQAAACGVKEGDVLKLPDVVTTTKGD